MLQDTTLGGAAEPVDARDRGGKGPRGGAGVAGANLSEVMIHGRYYLPLVAPCLPARGLRFAFLRGEIAKHWSSRC